MWLEEVRGLLVGRTIVEVGYRGTPNEEDPELCATEGIVLTLDDGSTVYVGADYEDPEFTVEKA